MSSLFTAPLVSDCESVVLMELGELSSWCRRFAESDCCDTEAFRTIIRRTTSLCNRIPSACGALSRLVYWVLVLFKTRSTELDREGVRAVSNALSSVRSIWLEPYELEQVANKLLDAGVRLEPF